MISLAGTHTLIVGGSRGIGAAAARMAAKAGAAVTITYVRGATAADALVKEIAASGGQAQAVQAEISDYEALEAAVRRAVATFGPLSGLVVSAGLFVGKSLRDMTPAFWQEVINVNLTGTFCSVKAAEPHLLDGASIVIYTSTAGQRGSAVFSAYATAKGGQILFMRSMALELAARRIRVNCIAPSWTETDMSGSTMDEIGREKILAGCPLGRVGLPEDVAGATLFLLSDLAKFVTGTTMTVDGGIDMRG
jgi:NAD(P)-dependent dehydrogenase (short-subunit alcohol dehydrogenase family)